MEIFEFTHTLQDGSKMTVGFNVNNVLTTALGKDGALHISLIDWHEEVLEIPQFTNSGKPKDPQKQRKTINTTIVLDKEDADRFRSHYVTSSGAELETETLGEDLPIDEHEKAISE